MHIYVDTSIYIYMHASTRICRSCIYRYMLFHIKIVIVLHLYVYAFPMMFSQSFHISQTIASSRGPTFRPLLWLAAASGCPRPLCAKAQGCQPHIAARAATIEFFQQPVRQSSVAAAIPHRIGNAHKAGPRRIYQSDFWCLAARV